MGRQFINLNFPLESEIQFICKRAVCFSWIKVDKSNLGLPEQKQQHNFCLSRFGRGADGGWGENPKFLQVNLIKWSLVIIFYYSHPITTASELEKVLHPRQLALLVLIFHQTTYSSLFLALCIAPPMGLPLRVMTMKSSSILD